MSGKGIHLVLPAPTAITADEAASRLVAVKDPERRYEILLCHWVTFTMRPLARPENPTGDVQAWETFAKDLVARAPKRVDKASIAPLDPKDAPKRDAGWERAVLLATQRTYPKTPEDFSGDLSRYEYGFLVWCARRLRRILRTRPEMPSPANQAWLLYDCARRALEWRPKHDENRLGMPWLLYQAENCIGMLELEEAKPEEATE